MWHKLSQSRNLGLAFSVHKQPFLLAYYYGNDSIKWCFSFSKPVPPLMLCSHPSMMCSAEKCTIHQHQNLTIFELPAPQSDMLHSQYAITTHPYQLSVYLIGGNKVCPQETKHTSYILIGEHFPHHCHSTSTYPINIIQLTLVPPVACYSYCKCYPLWGYKCLIHKSNRPVNLIFIRDILLCAQ